MKLTIFLTVMFVIFLVGKIATGYFAPSVPFLEALQTPLTWLSIVTGVLMGLCILLEILKMIKELISNGKNKE